MTEVTTGTTPRGTEGGQQAAKWVQGMFAEIAPRYDLLNHLLSFNIDRGWRKALLKSLLPVLSRHNAKVLDLCCGTGDVMLAFEKLSAGQVLGADFCHPMLVRAQEKARQAGHPALLFDADALDLPLANDSLDAVAISFGFRNLASYADGLAEARRVLKPGGTLAILEFSHPRAPIIKAGYNIYSRVILPVLGSLVSGSREAYSYLPESIAKFPVAEELQRMMTKAGFEQTRIELLSGGIAALHTGAKLPADG